MKVPELPSGGLQTLPTVRARLLYVCEDKPCTACALVIAGRVRNAAYNKLRDDSVAALTGQLHEYVQEFFR